MVSFLACAALGLSHFIAESKLLFDGRFNNVTSVEDLGKMYMLHILEQRQDKTNKPENYLEFSKEKREPSFNGDSGICEISADNKAIFNQQTNFRRTEIVKIFEMTEIVVVQASIYAEVLSNALPWQNLFDEGHTAEMRVVATDIKSPKLMFISNSDITNPIYTVDFSVGVWHNCLFLFNTNKKTVDFYYSTGVETLKLVGTKKEVGITLNMKMEFHFGLLTLSENNEELKIVKETFSLSGITISDTFDESMLSGGGASSTSKSSSSSSTGTPPTSTSPTSTPPTSTSPTNTPSSEASSPGAKCTQRVR